MKILISFIFVFLTVFNYASVESYRILGVFPVQSKSHNMLFNAIAKGLARKGHQVDMMTYYPLKNPPPNYKVVVNLETKDVNSNNWSFEAATNYDGHVLVTLPTRYGNNFCVHLKHPDLQAIIKNPPQDPPYDAVIVVGLASHCYIGLGYKLKVPVIMASSVRDLPWITDVIGQPLNSAFFPNFFTNMEHPLTFFERMHNLILNYLSLASFRRYSYDFQNDIARKYIDPEMPSLSELQKNVTVALMNSYHSLQGIRPMTPGFIEVGGIHVMEHYEKMAPELERWMNESTAGVVMFTLGSMVVIETMPENVVRSFYAAFKKLAPVRILIKVANKDKLLPGLPNNVKTSSWIPQVAVLAHKNTKVFITHGGLMSTQEALTFGVPMVGIPLFTDQFTNINCYVKRNMALKLSHDNLTETSIHEALSDIIYNPKYRNAANFEKERYLDRPMSAMDTAIYWIEYVIRHGPGTLRSPLVDLPLWKADLLDVYVFLLLSIIFIIYVAYLIAKTLILRILFTGNASIEKSHEE